LGIRRSFHGVSHTYGLCGLLLAFGCGFLSPPAVQAGYLDLSWDAPTTNVDGTPLTDLSEYRIYVGTSSPPPCPGPIFLTTASPTPSPSLGDVLSYHLAGLTDNSTYFVQVTAVDTGGIESACSNEASGIAHADGTGAAASGSSSDGGGGGGCLIATAAYGSPMAPEVQLLREFRNRHLLSHAPGRRLVVMYNALSPSVARVIAQSNALRSLVRIVLRPVLWWVHLFFWSPVLALGVLLGTPVAILPSARRFASRYRPATIPR